MVRIILYGCNGAMGKVVSELVKENKDFTIVAGVDVTPQKREDFPVYQDINDIKEEADAIVDFAHISAVSSLLEFTKSRKIPLVLCTTGLEDVHIQKIKEYSKEVAILRSANMSLGVNLLLKLIKEVSLSLYNADFDIEIVEKHHRRKLDAPSGTALSMAEAVNEALHGSLSYVYERESKRQPREKKELGISSVRGGSIVGEHDIIFAGEDELITLSHSAYSRKIFAKGALSAAKYLLGKQNGLYTMTDVIENR